jgi:SAM-dependent methyltransferase
MNDLVIKDCPACGHRANSELFVYRGDIAIARCDSCETEFSKKRFSETDLEKFYGADYFEGQYGYADYGATADMKIGTFEDRLNTLATHIALVSERQPRILDVGCADGLLVRRAHARGWESWGIDISREVIEVAKQRADGEGAARRLVAGVLETHDFAGVRFDALVMSDMIEHVHDPYPPLKKAFELLQPSGILLIETPNQAGLMRRIMGSRWAMYRPPEHLLYFNPTSLQSVLERSGFEVLHAKASKKVFTLPYLRDKLTVSNPLLARGVSIVSGFAPNFKFWLPSGSFMTIARKK